ncbi:hypothetical protein NDU88_006205 [Pleurodeles waltl]|uniref:Myb/SANT-like DNA-binding domain-containing protein n=1 Tax=Pleurodeles waltl TaxID=8319 RepID=A0AAV7UKB1_PLEWA|nr:hypothetical protein NDU88_006205 [Pleurodeles waltl]
MGFEVSALVLHTVAVSAHQKKDIWRAIAKEVRTQGAHQRRGTHCRKRWEDIRRCSKKTAEAQLGMTSQRGRDARRTMNPLMFRILAGDFRVSCDSSKGGEGPEEVCTACCYHHGGEGQHHSQRPGLHRQHRRHWSGDHRQSHCPGGHKYRHWSGDHSIVTGQETTARVIAQEGPSIVTGQETTARVIAQEAPSIITGQETTARVIAQEGPSIVTGQETTARVIAQDGTSIITGQKTTESLPRRAQV